MNQYSSQIAIPAFRNSRLFINVLEELDRQYCHAETLTLILDNYSIHKSRIVSDWLNRHSKFNLLFLPVYSPGLNKIGRLWQFPTTQKSYKKR